MIGRRLFVLLASLFVVMIGFGITLPVLPFYVERLAQAEGATPRAVVMHVALLTAAYPLGQLVFAPVWGLWSDRTGRRPLLLMGMAGYVIAQILFGLATSLWLLYVARMLGASCPPPLCRSRLRTSLMQPPTWNVVEGWRGLVRRRASASSLAQRLGGSWPNSIFMSPRAMDT